MEYVKDVPAHLTGLIHPKGECIQLNRREFVAIDRHRDSPYNATYRPQALYSRADEGFHANHESFLLHEVATNLPIHREDTGPTDFHLHLPPGGFQLVLVTSGVFSFDYDGQIFHVGPGAVMLQSAIVHRQLFYSWSGLETAENLATPQSVVPDSLTMGYSGKFLEAFVTDPTTFPNPTVVGGGHIDEVETARTAWSHPVHDRPVDACFWVQDPLSLDALYKRLNGSEIKSQNGVYVRDLGLETPSGHLVVGHIIATDPVDRTLLPKSVNASADMADLMKGEVAIYRMIRGGAVFKERSGKVIELSTGDTITASDTAIELTSLEADTQILRLGLMDEIENLRRWTSMQRDEIDGLGAKLISRSETRPLRTDGKPVGYLYGGN